MFNCTLSTPLFVYRSMRVAMLIIKQLVGFLSKVFFTVGVQSVNALHFGDEDDRK